MFLFTLTLELGVFLYVEKQHKQKEKHIFSDIPKAPIYGSWQIPILKVLLDLSGSVPNRTSKY